MSTSGLQVRCLASTRVPEPAWHRQETDDSNETENNGESKTSNRGDGFEQDEALNQTREKEEKEAEHHGQCRSDDSGARISTSTLGPESDSEDSDSSSDESSIGGLNSSSGEAYTSCIQEAQMSPDGTCIFTSDLNHSFSVYPIDTNIQGSDDPRSLKPYAQLTSADPIWAFASNPLFNINDSNSTHVLISRRDRYITLHNALWDISSSNLPTTNSSSGSPVNIATPLQSYKLINSLTEAVTAPLSLTYSIYGTHFFAGHRNSIATFDLTYPDAVVHNIPTIPSARNKLKGGGRGFKGWISALALSPPSGVASDGLLAAGARTRNIGIYDAASGEEVTTFSLPGTVDGKKIKSSALQDVVGDGVSYLKYSPCGTYLYVAERSSDALLIYDVRNFSLALGYCMGRKAMTKQKLGFDVWSAGASPYDIEAIAHEVWAGGTDGKIRVWRDPYRREGAAQPDEEIVVGDGDAPVVGTMVHENGGLAVAACGRVDVNDGGALQNSTGNRRGGSGRPRIFEHGSVDILGLS